MDHSLSREVCIDHLRRGITNLLISYASVMGDDNADKDLWNEIIDSRFHVSRLLLIMMKSNMRPFFQIRAAAAFFTPFPEVLPFHWINGVEDKYPLYTRYMRPKREQKANTVAQAIFFVVRDSMNEFDFNQCELPLIHFSSEMACLSTDVLVHADASLSEKDRILDCCNYAIIKLLGSMEESDPYAQRIFEKFSLNDYRAYATNKGLFDDIRVYDESGYNPFGWLLHEPNVPYKWKIIADQTMRDIVRMEMQGAGLPREKWENARGRYEQWVLYPVFYRPVASEERDPGISGAEEFDEEEQDEEVTHGGLPYSPSLFLDQLEFLTAIWETQGEHFSGAIGVDELPELVIYLQDYDCRSLQERLIRLWTRCARPYHSTSPGQQAKNARFTEIAESLDPDLGSKVNLMLALPEIRHEQGQMRTQSNIRRMQNFITRMKKPEL